MRKGLVVFTGLLLILVALSGFAGANEMTGKEVMLKVDNRDDGDTGKYKLKMTLINKADDERIRNLVSYRKDYGEETKTIMFFKSPADVKGTGYLSWEFDDPAKDDRRWLYMPALRKIRIITGSSDGDYFMGTDFTYDDMGERSVDEDNHTLLREEKLKENKCWVIKSVPKEESEYTKKIVWVRQDICMIVKVEYYNQYGLLKILKAEDIEETDSIWTEKKMVMENIQKEHKTILEFSEIEYNLSLDDNIFRKTTLKRGIR
ncbi:MAG: outer membrane lipoprotein-sorting protein [Halothermotrichaceae bacterium]